MVRLPVIACAHCDCSPLLIRRGVDCDLVRLLSVLGLSRFQYDHLPADLAMFSRHIEYDDTCSLVDISAGFDDYLARKQKESGKSIRQAMRKARKLSREAGPLRFTLHEPDSEDLLNTLAQWKKVQLEERNFADIFSDSWVNRMIRSLLALESSECRGCLSSLYAGDSLVALHLGVHNEHTLSSWIPTHNPAFTKYSPGMLLHLELFRSAAESGLKTIDLGRGENQLKTGLRTHTRTQIVGSVRNPVFI